LPSSFCSPKPKIICIDDGDDEDDLKENDGVDVWNASLTEATKQMMAMKAKDLIMFDYYSLVDE
jgi:hypothetical protein